jgi:chromosome segregation ATPase
VTTEHARLQSNFESLRRQQFARAEKVTEEALVVQNTAKENAHLQDWVNSLKEEVARRDADTAGLEEMEAEHTRILKNAKTRRQEVSARCQTASKEKKKLQLMLVHRDSGRQDLLRQREHVRQRREQAERDQQEFDAQEAMKQRTDERIKEQPSRIEGTALIRRVSTARASVMGTARAGQLEDHLAKYQEDVAAIERRFDILKREAMESRAQVELEQLKWERLWMAKHEEADRACDDLKRKIASYPPIQQMRESLQKLRSESERLAQSIAEKREAISRFSADPRAEYERMEQESRAQRERLAEEVRKLDDEAESIRAEAAALQHQEEETEENRGEIKGQTEDLRARQVSASHELDILRKPREPIPGEE